LAIPGVACRPAFIVVGCLMHVVRMLARVMIVPDMLMAG
jgi:hypothetical protein